MRTSSLFVHARRIALAGLLASTLSAQAAVVTFYGADDGVGPGGARPTADTASMAFAVAAGSLSFVDFEGLAVGNFGALGVAPGVTATLTNTDSGFCAGICSTDEHSPTPLGYNTTLGGTNHLRVLPNFNDPVGGTVTFSFANGINALGAFLTDTQENFPGPITVTFNDGSAQTLSVTKNGETGGVLFFGFVSDGLPITSVSFHTGATNGEGAGTRDLWGIDDLRFHSVPEPTAIALLGLAFAGLGFARRRKRH